MDQHIVTIMRHAKSDWDASARRDFDRPLAPRGERDAARMAKWLSEQAFRPTHIVSSPARRARQTAEIMAPALGDPPISWRDDLYLAELRDLLAVLARPPAAQWMLVGHNPGLGDLVEFCVPEAARRSQFAKLMPTAGIYTLAIDAANGPLASGCGRLLAHERPKRLV